MRRKITVTEGESSGAVARRLAERDFAEVVLLGDVAGVAADVIAAAPLVGYEPAVSAGDWPDTTGSTVVVVTDPPRADLEQLAERCPDAVVVVETDRPEDCRAVLDRTGFPRGRVIGLGGVLASARLRALLARELRVSVRDVWAMVLGGTGAASVPVLAPTLTGPRVENALRTAAAAGPSGPIATSAAVAEIVDSILLERRRVLPCAVLCQGEYGIDNVFASVPVRIGAGGVERIVGLDLEAAQRNALRAAVMPPG